MIQLAVIPLVLAVWAAVIWAAERTTPPAPRIAPRPPTFDVPDPTPLPEWATVPGPAAWSAGHCHRTNDLPTIAAFENPPHPLFRRQPAPTLTASVAAAWDHWEAEHDQATAAVPAVHEIRPGAPIVIELAA